MRTVDVSAVRITGVDVEDVRFPTSLRSDGTDAMNPDPDYSAAYVVLRTDREGLEGHGFTFTIGFGNEICVTACQVLSRFALGVTVGELGADMGGFARRITGESHLRWLGPEKGVVALASAAVINAAWDLLARARGVPLWKLLADMSPEELVDLVDFRYLTDALTRDEALELLRVARDGRTEREQELLSRGYPAYTTTPGWLGYSDAKLRALCEEAVADGFDQVKLKVGADLAADVRRCRIARETIGPDVGMALDANQVWDVTTAVDWVRSLAPFAPAWIEEPTSPDDVLGHAAIARAVAPLPVATGEQAQNRVVFKQLLQAGGMAVCQVDACRMAGVNEVVAVLLLAAKYGVPVCPHAGGVGLCELVVHLSAFDYLAVSASMEGRRTEWVDHLHEHFVEPARVERGRYRMPVEPGYAQMRPESRARHRYPDGEIWAQLSSERPGGPTSAEQAAESDAAARGEGH